MNTKPKFDIDQSFGKTEPTLVDDEIISILHETEQALSVSLDAEPNEEAPMHRAPPSDGNRDHAWPVEREFEQQDGSGRPTLSRQAKTDPAIGDDHEVFELSRNPDEVARTDKDDANQLVKLNVGADSAAAGLGSLKIGEILHQSGLLKGEQVQAVLQEQRRKGKLFGETAIELGFIQREQIIWALSQQFGYSYSGAAPGAQAHEELVMANAPFSDAVECFRNLRSDLSMSVLSPAETDRPALAFVSPNIGDGKTFVISNLAVAFSQARMRTLVIDADMRSPRLHEVFGVDNRIGLSNVLSGRSEMQVIQPISYLPNLYMLPAGTLPPNPTELIHQPAFGLLIREAVAKFDVVLVDTPAAVHGSDATVASSRCGAALVVARNGQSRVAPLKTLLERLRKGNVNIAGVMMNTV